MPRMSSYGFLKFERYPTGNRHSLDIPNGIHSPRGKKVTSQRVSCSISRHPPSCVHTARTCGLHATCRCARTRYRSAARVSGCIVPACSTTAGAPLLHYRRSGSSENGCRGRAEGISRFVSLKNHAGKRREREISSHLREASFAIHRICESAQRKNSNELNESPNTPKNSLADKVGRARSKNYYSVQRIIKCSV